MRRIYVGGVGVACVFIVVVLWQYAQVLAIILSTLFILFGSLYAIIHLYDRWLEIQGRHQQQTLAQPRRKVATEQLPISTTITVEPSDLAVGSIAKPSSKGFLWGYDAASGEEVRSAELRSTGIMGMQGSGKTVTTMHWILEAIRMTQGNIRFIVVDPHMNGKTGQELMSRVPFIKPFLLTLQDVRSTVQEDDEQYQRLLRKHSAIANPSDGVDDADSLLGWCDILIAEYQRRRKGKASELTWVLIVDEYSEVMTDGEDTVKTKLGETFKRLGQSARKFSIHALIIGQDFRANSVGDTGVRNTVPCWFVHRSNEAWSASVLPSRFVKQSSSLATGHALAYTSDGQVVEVEVPMTELADATRVAKSLAPTRPVAPTTKIEGAINDRILATGSGELPKQAEPDDYGIDSIYLADNPTSAYALVEDEFDPDEVRLVVESFIAGLAEVDIAKKVYGVKSGPELAEARIKVRNIMAWKLSR